MSVFLVSAVWKRSAGDAGDADQQKGSCGDTTEHEKPKVEGDHYEEALHAVEPDFFRPTPRPTSTSKGMPARSWQQAAAGRRASLPGRRIGRLVEPGVRGRAGQGANVPQWALHDLF